MRSTGIEALDSRIGGIEKGGLFLVVGPDGVGKSVLGLHFLAAGLAEHEPCLLVTNATREEIDGRGMYIGLGPDLSKNPDLTVIDVAAETANHPGRHAPAEALRQRLNGSGAGVITRVVIDDMRTFLRHSHTPTATARAAVDVLRNASASAYVTASTADLTAPEEEVLDAASSAATAVLELEWTGRSRRRFVFKDVRQKSFSTEPFMYTLRSGGGFSEDLPAYDREVEHDLRRKIVVLDEVGVIGDDVLQALSASFEIETFQNLDRALSKLLEAHYGLLVLGVDPYDPERVFNLTYTLRKAGNGAPILFVSSSRGLRSTTRSRGLRIGGDDFLLSELPPAEIVERIRVTADRGHHRRNGSVRPDRQLQPRDDEGEVRPMTTEEFQQSLRDLIGEAPTPFFALAVLDPRADLGKDQLWESIQSQLRLDDGDLVSILPDGTIAMVINQVDQHLAERVLSRIRRSAPELSSAGEPTLFTSPLQEDKVRRWVETL